MSITTAGPSSAPNEFTVSRQMPTLGLPTRSMMSAKVVGGEAVVILDGEGDAGRHQLGREVAKRIDHLGGRGAIGVGIHDDAQERRVEIAAELEELAKVRRRDAAGSDLHMDTEARGFGAEVLEFSKRKALEREIVGDLHQGEAQRGRAGHQPYAGEGRGRQVAGHTDRPGAGIRTEPESHAMRALEVALVIALISAITFSGSKTAFQSGWKSFFLPRSMASSAPSEKGDPT